MYCDKCAYNFADDMCCAYKIIMSYAYCPQIKECDRFKPRRNRNEE